MMISCDYDLLGFDCVHAIAHYPTHKSKPLEPQQCVQMKTEVPQPHTCAPPAHKESSRITFSRNVLLQATSTSPLRLQPQYFGGWVQPIEISPRYGGSAVQDNDPV